MNTSLLPLIECIYLKIESYVLVHKEMQMQTSYQDGISEKTADRLVSQCHLNSHLCLAIYLLYCSVTCDLK